MSEKKQNFLQGTAMLAIATAAIGIDEIEFLTGHSPIERSFRTQKSNSFIEHVH